MAVTFVKNVGSASISMATTGTVTVPVGGVALGNLLVVRTVVDTSGQASYADSRSNTYTRRIDNESSTGEFAHLASSVLTTALVSGDTITVTVPKSTGLVVVDEFSGVGTFDAIGTTGTGSSTTPSGSLSPGVAGLLLAAVYSDTLVSVSVEDADNAGGDTWHALTLSGSASRTTLAAYKITTSAVAQTYDPTLNVTGPWADTLLSWGAASTGPSGIGAVTLQPAAVSGSGTLTISGSGALTLKPIEVSGTGIAGMVGTGAITLPPASISGAGGETFTATGALTLPPASVSGTGAESFDATGALTLAPVAVEGTGDHTLTVTATGALTLQPVSVSGTGALSIPGSGAVTLPPAAVGGTGIAGMVGTGSLTLPSIAVSGTGTGNDEVTGNGALTLPPASVSGSGIAGMVGSGALTLPPASVAGTGSETFTATGSLTLAPASVGGTGTAGGDLDECAYDYPRDYDDPAQTYDCEATPPQPSGGGTYRPRLRQPMPIPVPQKVHISGVGAIRLAPAAVRGLGDMTEDEGWLYGLPNDEHLLLGLGA
jgi:hypothetical protein